MKKRRRLKMGEIEKFLLMNVSFLRETLKTNFKSDIVRIFMSMHSFYTALGFKKRSIYIFTHVYNVLWAVSPQTAQPSLHPSPSNLLHFPEQNCFYFLVIYTDTILYIYRNLGSTNEREISICFSNTDLIHLLRQFSITFFSYQWHLPYARISLIVYLPHFL